MAANEVGVMGLQETKVHCVEGIPCWLQGAGALAAEYSKHSGKPAQLTGANNPTGGLGFLVHRSLVPHIRSHGHINGHPDTLGTSWLTAHDTSRRHPLHKGFVYMADSSKATRNPSLSPSELASTSQDIHQFDTLQCMRGSP
jgi:hypothetical protein